MNRRATIKAGNTFCIILGDSSPRLLADKLRFGGASSKNPFNWESTDVGTIRTPDTVQDNLKEAVEAISKLDFTKSNVLQGKSRKPRPSLFDLQTGTFPLGLLPRVLEVLKVEGVDVSIEDGSTPPQEFKRLREPSEVQHRDYQHEAERVLLLNGARRGIVEAPTGSGKTFMIARVAWRLSTRVLVLVHSAEIFHQSIKFYSWYFGTGSVGALGCGDHRILPFTVAMVQTARHRTEDLKKAGFGAILVDEAHRAATEGYADVFTAVNPYYAFGFTGTAFRTGNDALVIEALLGGVSSRSDRSFLEEEGFLSKPIFEAVEVKGKLQLGLTYKQSYEAGIVRHAARNAAVCKKAASLSLNGKPVLIHVVRKLHGKILKGVLDEVGVSCLLIDGSMDHDFRQDAIGKTRSGLVRVLITTDVAKEGVDIPNLCAVVMAGGGKSRLATLQKMGRGMRRDGEKVSFALVDFYDGHNSYLEGHSKKRFAAYAEANIQIPESMASKILHVKSSSSVVGS